ncbi:acylphosphatase, partial [Candidatus Bipolaricaulota bacterium]|nr:acylphosphatase [Candidatus Bipolaricaulota bacterium]
MPKDDTTRRVDEAEVGGDPVAAHVWVTGRVQGVFYRASAQQAAVRFGVSGWVRNLADGRVEVWAEGSPQAVERLVS